MQKPKLSGSHYREYKGADCIVLITLVGPEYEFLLVEIGSNGWNSDGGIWDQGQLKKMSIIFFFKSVQSFVSHCKILSAIKSPKWWARFYKSDLELPWSGFFLAIDGT